MVSGLAFYSDDPSSNPAEANSFFFKIRVGPFKKIDYDYFCDVRQLNARN